MSILRIVNPALEPPRVEFESADEQATLREFASRDAGLRGFKLLKSDDDGKTWAEVEARALAAASSSAGEKADTSDPDKSKSEGSRKASK